jgi:hypothetical protein
MNTTTPTRQYRDTRIDVKLILCALWATMLIVFAYGDIFGLLRADVLRAALDGRMAATMLSVDQAFLAFSSAYVLIPALMVILALVLAPRVSRVVNAVVALVYAASVAASCVGETWAYFLLGSAAEVVLLGAIIRTAWTWPRAVVGRDGAA